MAEYYYHRNVDNQQGRITALLSVGGNLPGPNGQPPLETCREAVARLDLLPGITLRGVSRWFLTAPVPPSGQPEYVNAVAAILVDPAYAADPVLLLRQIMAIEATYGRARGAANAARTLDLDIIAIGDMVRPSPDPILPHPRAHERAFVLVPLLDVAPDWIHPVLGRSAKDLLADLPPQEIRPL